MTDATSFFTTAVLPQGAADQLNPSTAPSPEKVRELAVQFEGLLMSQMLREMRRSMLDEESDGLGAETTTDMIDADLGLALSRAGGLGLAEILMRAFEQRALSTQPPAAITTTNPGTEPATAIPAPPGEPLMTPPTGPVSSAFGWRSDPFNGKTQFHAGTDIRMAYGEDVHAAAPGVVSFAGDRPGYGLTVVVKHTDGKETLYAHLSASEVHTGDQVNAGQRLARSGNSGRSTGPHLHFEVRRDGQAVDPFGAVEGVAQASD